MTVWIILLIREGRRGGEKRGEKREGRKEKNGKCLKREVKEGEEGVV